MAIYQTHKLHPTQSRPQIICNFKDLFKEEEEVNYNTMKIVFGEAVYNIGGGVSGRCFLERLPLTEETKNSQNKQTQRTLFST